MKLNLASGADIKDGWVNFDIVPKWPGVRRGCDVVWDARKDRIPFPDGSAEEIYAGYLLLHLAPMYHPGVLREIWRVLSPEGILRIGEVDMEVAMKRWIDNPTDDGGLIWGEQGWLGGEAFSSYDKHCKGFTERSLCDLLTKHGFKDFRRVRIHNELVWYELTIECGKGQKEDLPLISVITPTMRVGGLDVTFEGLSRQTYRNFEIVLVDSFCARRSEVVKEKANNFGLQITHIPPIDNPFPVNAYCRYVNTGLRHARGSRVVFMSDYTWADVSCIENHAKGEDKLLALPYGISKPLPVRSNFPVYGPGNISVSTNYAEHYKLMLEAGDIYASDILSGKLDEFMWSIYDKTPTLDDIVTDVWEVSEPGRFPEGFHDNLQCNLRNESMPIEVLLSLNGLDEDLDGCHGWQDFELSDRIKTKLGLVWYSKPVGPAWMVKPYTQINARKFVTNDERRNEKIWLRKKAEGFSKPTNPSFNLRLERQEILENLAR